jgi:S-DNA-T family DNA segregation ATPase FtsK/SpoIIIE
MAAEERSSAQNGLLLKHARDIVLKEGQASISLLQRRLRLGYPRAAILMKALEVHGVVSPPDHEGQRRVLIPTKGEGPEQ